MKKIIILLGIPGSGKGTQALLISEKFGHKHVSSGALLRALAADPDADPTDKAQLVSLNAGHMAPDDLIYKIVFREIQTELANDRGVILDGAIRNLAQAKHYQEFFEQAGLTSEVLAIHLDMPDDESLVRLTKRRICGKCNYVLPMAVEGDQTFMCPKCGSELVARSDDQPHIIKERLVAQGNEALRPLLEFYKQHGVLTQVNGAQDIAHVATDVATIIEKK